MYRTVREKKMDIPLQQANGFVDEANRQLTQQILRALQEIRYGSVEIVIHDSKWSRSNEKRRSASTRTLHEPPNEQSEYNPTGLLSELLGRRPCRPDNWRHTPPHFKHLM